MGYSNVGLATSICPVSKYVDPPAWSVEPHVSPIRSEVEVCCSDVREIPKILESFGSVGRNQGLPATKGKLQTQQCPDWDGEVIEETGMWWLRNNTEILQAREGYHPSSRGIRKVWDRIVELNVAEARDRLKKVEEPSQDGPILGNVTKAERCEAQ